MTFDEYQNFTCSTDHYRTIDGPVLGLLAEAGEVAALFERMFREGESKKPDAKSVCDELGDVLYYVARIAHWRGLTLLDVVHANHEKLSARLEAGTILKSQREG